MLWSRKKRSTVHVELVHADTGALFGQTEISPELPASLEAETTRLLGEQDFMIVSAAPMTAIELRGSGRLRLVLRRVKSEKMNGPRVEAHLAAIRGLHGLGPPRHPTSIPRLAGAASLALALALTATAAQARPPSAPLPAEERRRTMGFAAELGGSPAVFGVKLGAGVVTRSPDGPARRWMAWLEADGTDRFQPRRPAAAGRTDRVLWLYPHLEVARPLVRRPALAGWIRGGPTVGRYTAGLDGETLWFPGVAVGAGVLLDPVRLGVTWFGQWRQGTARVARASESPDVRMTPMVIFTAGLELLQPFPR